MWLAWIPYIDAFSGTLAHHPESTVHADIADDGTTRMLREKHCGALKKLRVGDLEPFSHECEKRDDASVMGELLENLVDGHVPKSGCDFWQTLENSEHLDRFFSFDALLFSHVTPPLFEPFMIRRKTNLTNPIP